MESVVQRGREATLVTSDQLRSETMREVYAATAKECEKGTMDGPFMLTQMNASFGDGHWRAMRRNGVWQKGKCRPCDDTAELLHNFGTVMHERLVCESADFPAVVAALYSEANAPLSTKDWQLFGGSDDIEAAFRRAMCGACTSLLSSASTTR